MRDNIITFHKTVHGYRHIQEEIPCQDSSTSCESTEENYQIICVADGHGDPACHRSDKGSKFVVEIAEKCLKDFAAAVNSGDMPFAYSRQQSECMEQLTNTIISKWYGAVRNDLLEHEVTEEDFSEAGRYEDAYRTGDRLEHLYGTTLIATLKVKNYLILIQQGDGHCVVFYADGSVNQPIPWDERCKGSTTTSMCDKDVFNRIRTAVIDLSNQDVVACFMGSDGVEDSYFDNEESQLGTHRFYMDLGCKLYEYGLQRFEDYLEDMLPAFSRTGSADDVSVAGIVDLDKIAKLIDVYAERVKKYDISAKLKVEYEEVQSKIISMTRKHGILSERATAGEDALAAAQELQQSLTTELQKLKTQRKEYVQKVDQAKVELDEYRQDSQSVTVQFEGRYPRFAAAIQRFVEEISTGYSMKETAYRKMLEQLLKYDSKIKQLEEAQSTGAERIRELEAKLDDAQAAFSEYDTKYQAIDAERIRIENEMAALQEGN